MKSKLSMFLLSLVIAFGMWFYVISVVSPDSEISLNNVHVDVQGENTLLELSNLMVVTDVDDIEVDLVLHGNRSDLIKLNRNNITITVDVSKIDKPGKHEVVYDIALPGDVPSNAVSVQTRDPDRITLQVEKRVVNREVPLILSYDKEDLPGGYTVKESGMIYPEYITVSGPESAMKNVDHAEAYLDLTDRQESFLEEQIPYVLYDKDGNVLEHELLEHEGEITVTMPIYYTKDLPLSLILKAGGGATEKDAQVKFYIPRKDDDQEPDEEITSITVSGSKALLDGETVLNLANVDLATVRDGDKLTFKLDELPLLKEEGINNESGITEIYAQITFNGLKEREFADMLVQYVNVPEGMQANGTRRVSIVVRGPEALIEKLSREEISVTVDLAGVDQGKEYYTVKVVFAEGFETLGALAVDPVLVEVIEVPTGGAA